jgi:hypothetical protein
LLGLGVCDRFGAGCFQGTGDRHRSRPREIGRSIRRERP